VQPQRYLIVPSDGFHQEMYVLVQGNQCAPDILVGSYPPDFINALEGQYIAGMRTLPKREPGAVVYMTRVAALFAGLAPGKLQNFLAIYGNAS
jgi:hypothetical protein